MPRRVTIPNEHVAVVISAKLADELMSLMRTLRQANKRAAALVEQCQTGDDKHGEAAQVYDLAGELMLALLEAQEA